VRHASTRFHSLSSFPGILKWGIISIREYRGVQHGILDNILTASRGPESSTRNLPLPPSLNQTSPPPASITDGGAGLPGQLYPARRVFDIDLVSCVFSPGSLPHELTFQCSPHPDEGFSDMHDITSPGSPNSCLSSTCSNRSLCAFVPGANRRESLPIENEEGAPCVI